MYKMECEWVREEKRFSDVYFKFIKFEFKPLEKDSSSFDFPNAVSKCQKVEMYNYTRIKYININLL